jgi:DNA anti-recombination protein RmuC
MGQTAEEVGQERSKGDRAMTQNEKTIVQGIGRALKKRFDAVENDFNEKVELLGRGIVKVRDDFQGLSANTSNDSQQAVDKLRQELRQELALLKTDVLNEVRVMLLALVPRSRRMSIVHSDGTESRIVEEEGDNDSGAQEVPP